MVSIVVMTALTAGLESPGWKRLHYPCHWCAGFRGVDPWYDGGWWYGATAWDGCPPQYISPPWNRCGCGCGLDGPFLESRPSSSPEPAPAPKPDPDGDDTRAEVTLDVPAGGRLYVDGQLIGTTPGRQTFTTPVLKPGQVYYYEVAVEVFRDGRSHRDQRRLVVRPGEQVQVTFTGTGPELAPHATAGR
jgi:uncharacterized protein (TIGR03000 family)